MNAPSTSVHCVVVTPEKTELDVQCDSLVLPLYDGEFGVLPNHAPMVGRLGFGMMRVKSGSDRSEWFVDGGFVQITREAVFVLTDRLLKPEQIDSELAKKDLAKATELKATSEEAYSFKERAIAQARAKIRLGKKH